MPSITTKLLIVDDESLVRALLAQIFRQRGYEVKTAGNGLGALKIMREWTPEILVLDLNMPEMSGFELLSIVRRRSMAMYVVVSSGSHDGTEIPGGLMADAYHTKGGGIQGLVETVGVIAQLRPLPLQKRSPRASMPIWTERCENYSGKEDGKAAYAMISCPDCLRAVPQALDEADGILREMQCPHCGTPVQFAVVQEMQGYRNDRPAAP
jgi:CheY-like chemotaxis protein